MKTDMQTAKKETALARPLKVLVPLIREEIEAGESAGMEHYQAAGEMLNEAKSQLERRTFKSWFEKQSFPWSLRMAQRYMGLAGLHHESSAPRAPTSLRQALGEISTPRTHAPWVAPVRAVTDRVNTDGLALEMQSRRDEERLTRQLGLQLIDIGFKVLAAKLHPDKPDGSAEAMRRLNTVRKTLQGAL